MKKLVYCLLFIHTLIHTAVPDVIESSLVLLQECMQDQYAYIPRIFNEKLNTLLADIDTDDLITYMLEAEKMSDYYLINGMAAIIVDRLEDDPVNKEVMLSHLQITLKPETYAFINKYIHFKSHKKATRACGGTELSVADYVSLYDVPLEYLGNVGILRFDNRNLTSLYGMQDISLSDVGLIILSNNCIVGDTLDPQFPNDPFSGLSNAYNLLINKNMIESLPATFFQSTPLMQSINLSQNRLTSLPSVFTSYTDQLALLKLSYNQLTSIPISDMISIPILESLYLDNNAITDLPSNLLSANPTLHYLFLNNNQLTQWPTSELDAQTELIYLDLSYNSLIDFAPAAISKGAEVVLTGNPLTSSQQDFIQSAYPDISFLF